jgi:alkanesulfonate monooxygenase SsuD/methylene tetrahydromethanopterin reductase-like flavin-dependent oxidoreductase (luciferase family)
MWPPQLARQLATIDQMLGGRLTVNIISSDLPGRRWRAAALPADGGGDAPAAHAAERQESITRASSTS